MSNKALYRMLVGTVLVLVITIGLYVGMEIAEEKEENNVANKIEYTDEVLDVVSPVIEVKPYIEEKLSVVVKYVDIYGECGHEKVQLEQYNNAQIDNILEQIKQKKQEYSLMENNSNMLIFQKKYDCFCMDHFLIKLGDETKDEIIIYKVDDTGKYAMYETRNVELKYLRETLMSELKVGINAYGYEHLLMILEDIES